MAEAANNSTIPPPKILRTSQEAATELLRLWQIKKSQGYGPEHRLPADDRNDG
jgi:hypothetical protein